MLKFSIWERITNKFPQLEVISLSSLWSRLDQLPPRERKIVVIAIASILTLIVFSVLKTTYSNVEKKEKQLANAKSIYKRVVTLSSQVQQTPKSNSLVSKIRPAGSGFYLSSFIEQQASRYQISVGKMGAEARQNIGENIEEVTLDVKINQISFPKMLHLLSNLEETRETLVRLQRVRIESIPNDPTFVELNFKISAFMRKT